MSSRLSNLNRLTAIVSERGDPSPFVILAEAGTHPFVILAEAGTHPFVILAEAGTHP